MVYGSNLGHTATMHKHTSSDFPDHMHRLPITHNTHTRTRSVTHPNRCPHQAERFPALICSGASHIEHVPLIPASFIWGCSPGWPGSRPFVAPRRSPRAVSVPSFHVAAQTSEESVPAARCRVPPGLGSAPSESRDFSADSGATHSHQVGGR